MFFPPERPGGDSFPGFCLSWFRHPRIFDSEQTCNACLVVATDRGPMSATSRHLKNVKSHPICQTRTVWRVWPLHLETRSISYRVWSPPCSSIDAFDIASSACRTRTNTDPTTACLVAVRSDRSRRTLGPPPRPSYAAHKTLDMSPPDGASQDGVVALSQADHLKLAGAQAGAI